MKIISTLVTGKYKMICHDKDCTTMLHRDDVLSVIDNKARTCFDTLQFLYEYMTVEPDRIIYWCFGCRLVSCKLIEQNTKCISCNKKQDKLKSVFTLIKLALVSKDSKAKNYEAIIKCIDDCKSQVARCEDCLKWKHAFTGNSLKCEC